MRIVVKVVRGPGVGRHKMLLAGQALVVGRTSQADWDFPGNNEMSSVHFQLRCDDRGGLVKDLKSRNGTFLNDQPLEGESPWRAGELLRAGSNTFSLHTGDEFGGDMAATERIESEEAHDVERPADTGTAEQVGLAQPAGVPSTTIVDKAVQVPGVDGLSPEAIAMLAAELSPLQFAQSLLDRGLLADAARFLTHAFDRRTATQWGLECLRSQPPEPSPDDAAILTLVSRWLNEPSDALRRQVYAAGEKVGFGTAASWIALGAFWSEGSMAPPTAPAVPAAPHLTPHAICGAVQLASVAVPEQADARMREYLKNGFERLSNLAGARP